MQTRFRELSIGDRVSQSPRSTCTIYFYKFDKILFLYIDACRFLQQKWIICRETDCLTRGTSKIFISTTRERWTRWVCESLARQSVTSKFLRKTGQYYYTYYTTLGGMHMPFSTYNRARTFYWLLSILFSPFCTNELQKRESSRHFLYSCIVCYRRKLNCIEPWHSV